MTSQSLTRRRMLLAASSSLAALGTPALSAPEGNPLRLLQCIDPSGAEQEQERDYAAGAQAALQWARQAGNGATRPVRLEPHRCDGSPSALDAVLRRLRDEPGLLGLAATPGERLSAALAERLAASGSAVPHVAPWLPDARHDARDDLALVFASRERQLQQTVAGLQALGLRDLGLVHADAATRQRVDGALSALPAAARRWPSWTSGTGDGIEALVAHVGTGWPAVVLFAGGSLELARFVKALAARGVQRMVVHLGDDDLALLDQLGALRTQALVLTQVVPHPASTTARCSRHYRDIHARLYDDAPTTAGMAGFLAGRYLLTLLERLGPQPTRQALLDQLRRRADADLDGYGVRFTGARGSRYVNQVMLSRDGRLLL